MCFTEVNELSRSGNGPSRTLEGSNGPQMVANGSTNPYRVPMAPNVAPSQKIPGIRKGTKILK